MFSTVGLPNSISSQSDPEQEFRSFSNAFVVASCLGSDLRLGLIYQVSQHQQLLLYL